MEDMEQDDNNKTTTTWQQQKQDDNNKTSKHDNKSYLFTTTWLREHKIRKPLPRHDIGKPLSFK